MDQATHNKIVSFIWGIADDVLRESLTTTSLEREDNPAITIKNESDRSL
ncbi:MAG: hypothetical protein MUC83_02150 [Pirellula sp.]|nr:hypothetical protein [Pirellula sp.]